MDNKLTKKRLSNFMSYEWIAVLLIILAVVLVWEFIYSVSGVRLTSGQQFKFYIDQNVRSNTAELGEIILGKEEETFSFDVLEFDAEALTKEYNVLNVRLSVYEGDIIFTDSVEDKNGASRAKTIVDSFSVYTYEELLNDGVKYLKGFLKDGETNCFIFENLDKEKIKANFLTRMKGDNRFRSEEQKRDGVELEIERIKKLCKEILRFDYFIKVYAKDNPEIFYCYTQYSYSLSVATKDADKKQWQQLVDREKEQGRENAHYGINVSALRNGKRNVSEYVRVNQKDDAENVVLMAFDFYDVKDAKLTDLQFETISAINSIINEFSDVYSSVGM